MGKSYFIYPAGEKWTIYWVLAVWIMIVCAQLRGVLTFHCSKVSKTRASRGFALFKKKSKADFGLSERTLFLRLRDRLNKAAQVPGFLEQTKAIQEYQLYCWGDIEGKLNAKGVPYDLNRLPAGNSPKWIKEQFNSSIPLLVYKNVSHFSDPLEVAEHLDSKFPLTCLTRSGYLSYRSAIREYIPDVLESSKEYILNTDPNMEEYHIQKYNEDLDILDDLIRSTPGHYFCGIDLTAADFYLIPRLHSIYAALYFFKSQDIFLNRKGVTRFALKGYFNKMTSHPVFKHHNAIISSTQLIYGWKLAKMERLAQQARKDSDTV